METALLIDAENISGSFWTQILQPIGRKGFTVGKVFGDFGNGQCKQWREIAEKEGLELVLRPGGSNATDIAITVEAMDLLQTGRFDKFVLVSSDRDYRPLVERLRSGGMAVVGMGEAKSSPALKAVCSRFIVLKRSKPVAVNKAA